MMRSTLGRAALELSSEYGLPVFPCAPRTKTPLLGPLTRDGTRWVKGRDLESDVGTRGSFHRASTHPEQVCAWWDRWPDANIGVRLGGTLRLGMIEGDNPTANARIERMAMPWAPTWQYRSSRGINRVVRVPVDIHERPVRNAFEADIGVGFEIKTGGGFFVAPPSIHPTGHVYEWCAGRAPADIDLAGMPGTIAEEVRRIDARGVVRVESAPLPLHAESFDAVRTLDALRFLDADDYETWRDAGLALKHTGDASSRGVWDAWSASSHKYDAVGQSAAWSAFRPTSITVASIFHHAQSAGWSVRKAA